MYVRASDISTHVPQPTTPVVILDEFLVAQELRGLLNFTLERTPFFEPTALLGGDHGYRDDKLRRSRVLYDLGFIRELFVERLSAFIPYVLTRLGHPDFAVADIEIQLTATNDGEFFVAHSDNGAEPVDHREITFVYFFHNEPKAFDGGELRIYDVAASAHTQTGVWRSVNPQQNQVIFFPSTSLHEILPVTCPSRQFADSRFTVNGWLHR